MDLHQRSSRGSGISCSHFKLCHVLECLQHAFSSRIYCLSWTVRASYPIVFVVNDSSFLHPFSRYNAIHDPGNVLVISSTMLEGALDIVSATSLLALAEASEVALFASSSIIFL